MKILITGGKSALTLKALSVFATHEILLADYGEVPAFSSSNYRFVSLGELNEDTIAHKILNVCLDEQVDLVIPFQAFEVVPIAKAKLLFEEFNVKVLLPTQDFLSDYFDGNKFASKTDWVVYLDGEIIFNNSDDFIAAKLEMPMGLDGIFSFISKDGVAKLMLITI